mgnify:CR=1 FL=1
MFNPSQHMSLNLGKRRRRSSRKAVGTPRRSSSTLLGLGLTPLPLPSRPRRSIAPGVTGGLLQIDERFAGAPLRARRSILPRTQPSGRLQDWFYTGGEWGRTARALYEASYQRQAKLREVSKELAAAGLSYEEARRVIVRVESLQERGKPIPESLRRKYEWMAKTRLPSGKTVLEEVSEAETLAKRERELERAKEASERALTYEKRNIDSLIAQRTREVVGEARSMAVSAVKGARLVESKARTIIEALRRSRRKSSGGQAQEG